MMQLVPGDNRIWLVGPMLLLGVLGLASWLGSANLAGTQPGSIVSGEKLRGSSTFLAERGFIYYTVKAPISSLPLQSVEGLASRFGVSEPAILNANNARGQKEIKLSAEKSIRIPLRPR
ncbi:MAG: hypothetical protein JWM21_2969 [Acidobacteria bacterium]|nr:hypothetical protein [Acidobacteriota bacterium]